MGSLQDLEEEERDVRRRRNTDSPIHDDADGTPSIAPQGNGTDCSLPFCVIQLTSEIGASADVETLGD